MADELTTGIQKLAAELGRSNLEARLAEAERIKVAKEQLEATEKSMKEAGLEAKDSQAYRDEELRIKKSELALRKQGATSKAAREEIAKEESALQNNRFQKFFGENSYFGKTLGGLGDKLSSLGAGAKGALGTLALAGALGALAKFLQSETWQKLKEKVIPMIAGALQTFYNGMKEFADEFMAFVENPTLTNFKELFTGDSSKFLLGLAGIAALLNPLKALKLLRLGVTGLVAGFGALGRGLNRMSGPTDKQGRKLVKGKDGKMRIAAGQKGAGRLVAAKNITKGALRASRFLPGIGLAVTAAMGIFDGMAAGIEEYKKSGKLSTAVEAGIAGAASGLTFGLVSQETFQKGIDGIKTGLNAAWNATTSAYDSIKTGLVAFYDDPKGTFLAAKAAITKSVSETATKLKGKFEEITGIELPTFADIKTKMSAMKTSFEDITGLKVPTFSELQTKFDNLKTKVSEIKLPTFSELQTKFTELSTKVKEIKLPTFADLKTKFTELGTKIKAMEVPSFKDVGGALANFKKDAEDLTGIKLPDFSEVKKLIEEKLSFKFEDLKLPEFPDIGALITDAIRAVLRPIANLKFNVGFGRFSKEFSARSVLPQGFLDFVDQTGDYTPVAPSSPSRPASDFGPTNSFGERGRGEAPIVISQSSVNTRQGDNVSMAAGIMPSEPGLREATSSYG